MAGTVADREALHPVPMPAKTPKRRKRAPERVEPLSFLGEGEGRIVTIDRTVACMTCGEDVHVQYRGRARSAGVRITRTALKAGMNCTRCQDRLDAEELDGEIAERRERMRLSRIERSGVPERWRAVSFAEVERDPERELAIDAALQWAQADTPRGLLLWGEVGRGKTVIAAAAAMEYLQRRRLRWLNVAKLLTDLRGGFDSPSYTAGLKLIDSTSTDAALVLNDLDKTKPTEHSLQPLFVAIDSWLERPLPLIVTMNRSPDELADWAGETFGEALASRLVGYSTVVEVRGRDRRLD